MDFVIWIVVVVLAIILFNVKGKVENIERILAAKRREIPGTAVRSEPVQIPVPNRSAAISEPVSSLSESEEGDGSNFIDWLKEDWIMKLGALLLLIGFGWLTTYAFMNNWIGPVGRVSLGLIAGVVFLAIGAWRIQKYRVQGEVFLVLGSATVFVTTFAARMYYNFFDPPISALAIMFLSVVFVALAGVKYKSRYLPLISLVLAGIAPLLTNSPTSNYIELFSYLTIVVLGTVWIAGIAKQKGLITASLLMVFFYSLSHLSTSNEGLLLFMYLFGAIFLISSVVGIIRSKGENVYFDMITSGLTVMMLLLWILNTEQQELKLMVLLVWMLAFALGAFLVFRQTGKKEPFYIYAVSAIAMLAAATNLQLKGESLLIAYVIESIIIYLGIHFTMKDVAVAEEFTFLLTGPVILSINSISKYSHQSEAVTNELFSLTILMLALFGTGLFFWNKIKEAGKLDYTWVNNVWIILGSGYFYVLLWMFLQKIFFASDVAATITLIVYTIVGLVVYFYGKWNERMGFRVYGQILLGFVVLRLLLVDLGNMEIVGKIITLFLIGLLLLSTAFLGKKKTTEQ
ncbi:MAG: DUF2339 domain-containing protein [Candidatus Paceibacterota bacterium]